MAPLQRTGPEPEPNPGYIASRAVGDSSRDEREDARAVHLPAHVAARLAPGEERLRPVPCVCGSLARRVLSQSGSLEGYGNSRTHLYPCGGVPHCHVWYVGPSHLSARRLPVMTRSSRWVGRVLIYAGRYEKETGQMQQVQACTVHRLWSRAGMRASTCHTTSHDISAACLAPSVSLARRHQARTAPGQRMNQARA